MKLKWPLLSSLIAVPVSSITLVASCSIMGQIVGELFMNNLVKSLDNFYLKMDELDQKYSNLKPTEVFVKLFDNFPSPVENYGYQNLVQKISPDDESGLLNVEIKTFFSNDFNTTGTFTFNLKSNQQAEIDQEIKPLDYFNVDSQWLMTKVIDVKDEAKKLDPFDVANQITSATDQISELAKYINLNKDKASDSVLKKALNSDEKLIIKEIKTIKHLGIIDQIFIKLQISKNNKTSSPLLLTIKGFEGDETQGIRSKLTNTFLEKYAQDFLSSLETPLKNNGNQTLDVFASDIKTKEELLKLFKDQSGIIEHKKLFDLDDVNLKVSLIDLVANSAIDEQGSLKATFKLELNVGSKPAIILDNQQVRLYGFKVKS